MTRVQFVSTYQGETTYTAHLPDGPRRFHVRRSAPDYLIDQTRADSRPHMTEEVRERTIRQYLDLVGTVRWGGGDAHLFPPREIVEAIAADLNKDGFYPPDRYVGARFHEGTVEYDGEPPPAPERAGDGPSVPMFARWWNELHRKGVSRG